MKLAILNGITGFDWDPANISHIAEHDVSVQEAEDVFFDSNNTLDKDLKHSFLEKRFLIIGKTSKGRLLYQIFTRRGNKIRVISARDINRKEVPLYEEKISSSKVQK